MSIKLYTGVSRIFDLFIIQWMKMLFSKDMTQNTLCNGLKLSDLLTFKDPTNIDKVEEMLCGLNTTEFMGEIMKQPMFQELSTAVSLTVTMH